MRFSLIPAHACIAQASPVYDDDATCTDVSPTWQSGYRGQVGPVAAWSPQTGGAHNAWVAALAHVLRAYPPPPPPLALSLLGPGRRGGWWALGAMGARGG